MSEELLRYIKESVDRIEDKQDSHAQDISNIKQWQSNIDGKITMVGIFGVAIGGIATWFAEMFHK